jgi:hypothetical protein
LANNLQLDHQSPKARKSAMKQWLTNQASNAMRKIGSAAGHVHARQ